MPASKPTIAREIDRYLRTGETDPYLVAWSGGSFMEKARRARDDLRGALVRRVRLLARGQRRPQSMADVDTVALTRRKVQPMVAGLFPRSEQDAVLSMLEKSVVFVSHDNIESLLLGESFDHAAWTIANLYLASLDAELLGKHAPRLAGLSQETTCYVSPEYLRDDEPFADFIVHEAAHVFHNCKRATVGLRETRTREWLLDIDFRKRETFAYACEAYARVLERADAPARRRELAAELDHALRISEERVDAAEVARIVQAAAAARNGWKVILRHCAPATRPMSAVKLLRASWTAEDAATRE